MNSFGLGRPPIRLSGKLSLVGDDANGKCEMRSPEVCGCLGATVVAGHWGSQGEGRRGREIVVANGAVMGHKRTVPW